MATGSMSNVCLSVSASMTVYKFILTVSDNGNIVGTGSMSEARKYLPLCHMSVCHLSVCLLVFLSVCK